MVKDLKQTLLEGWEDVYKKSQLTLWILLSLKTSSSNMSEIKDFIKKRTEDTIAVDDKSMYRALRRFAEADLIYPISHPNPTGPAIKVWHLTETGSWVLTEFIKRNMSNVLLNPMNEDLWN